MSYKKRFFYALILFLVLLVLGEFVCVSFLGLGDPPLYVHDDEIEYLMKASARYERFGNEISINRFHMRSGDVTLKKTEADEFRVLVISDSVMNGGSLTDQAELATSLLEGSLGARHGGKVTVCNVSAGSWGPENQLAYVERFGLFDADAIVLVVNSEDAVDVIDYQHRTAGVRKTHPTKRPRFALEEAFFTYGLRYLGLGQKYEKPKVTARTHERFEAATTRLFDLFKKHGKAVFILHQKTQEEIAGGYLPGFGQWEKFAGAYGFKFIAMGSYFEEALKSGATPFRDNIHPNARGQKIIHDILKPLLEKIIAEQIVEQRERIKKSPTSGLIYNSIHFLFGRANYA